VEEQGKCPNFLLARSLVVLDNPRHLYWHRKSLQCLCYLRWLQKFLQCSGNLPSLWHWRLKRPLLPDFARHCHNRFGLHSRAAKVKQVLQSWLGTLGSFAQCAEVSTSCAGISEVVFKFTLGIELIPT
jgi:hypothetical protein